MRVVAERAGRALGLPHRRRLRRVTRHGVAGAGAVLRGHLPVFHDLLDLGSFVLKPDFHLGRGTKAYVTRTLRSIFGPPRPGPGVSPQLAAYRQGTGPEAWPESPTGEGALEGSASPSHWEGTTLRLLSFVWAGGKGRGWGRVSPAGWRTRVGLRSAYRTQRHRNLQNNGQSPARKGRGADSAIASSSR